MNVIFRGRSSRPLSRWDIVNTVTLYEIRALQQEMNERRFKDE